MSGFPGKGCVVVNAFRVITQRQLISQESQNSQNLPKMTKVDSFELCQSIDR